VPSLPPAAPGLHPNCARSAADPPPERSRDGRVSQTAVRRDALFAFSG